MTGRDDYGRLGYRDLIAWNERLERERPFLERELGKAPAESLLDLGCGTGEHALLFAALGYDTIGVDRSEEMIEKARQYEGRHPPHGPRFVHGDFAALSELVSGRLGGAICLGNVLPHLEDEAFTRLLEALSGRLLPQARFVLQAVNYERILGAGVRHLPLKFRPDPDGEGEIVFLRLMKPLDERHVSFHPTTLRFQPGREPPLELKATKEVRLRAWTRPQVERWLEAGGFRVEATYGDMTGGPYQPESSSDLVVVAERLA